MGGLAVDEMSHGVTPLHLASVRGHTNAVALLLETGASIHARDSNHLTPLLMAAERGHDVTVQLLLAMGSHVNATDLQEMTALHWAARMDHQKVAIALLDARADLNLKSGTGYTPLAMAEDWGTASMTRLLRERGGVRYC